MHNTCSLTRIYTHTYTHTHTPTLMFTLTITQTTSTAYEEMQMQNSRLLGQITEKDEANNVLLADRVKVRGVVLSVCVCVHVCVVLCACTQCQRVRYKLAYIYAPCLYCSNKQAQK